MSTSKQNVANQRNAARSTGPKTDSGKHTVSQNAVRHGLTSRKMILSSEEQAEFDKHRAGLLAQCKPANDHESRLAEMHAVNAWRLIRVRAQEVAFLDRAARQLMQQNSELSHDDAVSDLFLDPAHPEKLRLFLRYQAAIERAYAKSLAELEAAQAARRADEEAARAAALREELYADDEYEEEEDEYEDDEEEYEDDEEEYEDEENDDDGGQDGFVSQCAPPPAGRPA